MDELDLLKQYKQRDAALQNEQNEFIPTWQLIRDYLAPRTARFNTDATQVAREDLMIINTSPRFAVRTLPAGLQSGVTNPTRPWFRLGTPDPELQEYAPVKEWLFDTERLMREVMSRSNIYDRLKSNYGILGSYGTSSLFIEEDEEDVIRGYDLMMGSFRVCTDATGRVDTLFRSMELTAYQMVMKFKDRAPDTARRAFDKGNYLTKFPVLHVVEPNFNYKPGNRLSQYKKFGSIWIDPRSNGREAFMQLKGYDDQPHMCPRWDIVGEQSYGVGCGEIALGDAKQLQLMEKRKLQGIDKNVNPPMIADASMRNQRTTNLPGDTTYVNGLINGRPGYQPAYQVNPYISELREEIMRVEERINEAFYKNLFLMVSQLGDQPNITATQINTMREEKLLMLGPVLERLNDELLGPMIDRVFNIMARRGMLPPAPEELQGVRLKVEYISVLAQAQKAIGIANIERAVNFIGALTPIFPEAADKLNIDEAIEEYAEGTAVPPKLIRGPEEAAQIRDQRAQQQQAAQMAALAEQGANTAKAMSETNMVSDNALTRSFGAGG